MANFGKELILDLHGCDAVKFSHGSLEKFCKQLCKLIGMKPEQLAYWNYPLHARDWKRLRGLSAVQFIRTSSITIHALDNSGRLYVNLFSCKPFSSGKAARFTAKYFRGKIVQRKVVKRR